MRPAAPRELDPAVAVAVAMPTSDAIEAAHVTAPADAVHEPAVDDPAEREGESRAQTAAGAEDIDDQHPSSRWVDVPDGYRSVAWVRPQEAHAALQAYATRTDAQVRTDGQATGWARYHADESEKARKFRANVMLERMSPSGTQFVCWLRESEAAAIVQAVARRTGVPVGERGGGWVGHIEYYPPDSEEARRFRSSTRLLRVRGR